MTSITPTQQKIQDLRDRMQAAADRAGRLIRVMEVCGTHTVSASRSGLRSLISKQVKLVSGPGCPVCVTSQAYIDAVVDLALTSKVTIATYGDMIRVPGKRGSLEQARAVGANVRVVTSAMDALTLARQEPNTQVVFAAVGFETTTPPTADVLIRAAREGVANLSVLAAHKLVVPAMLALLASGVVQIDGFLCPGHVSVIIGCDAYKPVVEQYRKPCVVAGFEPVQMLEGLAEIVEQVAGGRAELGNVYGAAVRAEGNPAARRLVSEVFEVGDADWRSIGVIPGSGLVLTAKYRQYDAGERFGVTFGPDNATPGCKCGDVIRGLSDPHDCPLFGTVCTPQRPIGPCMVSSEGSCQAYYKYHRFRPDAK
jgi:hydrogenase expression/formation protein HypD